MMVFQNKISFHSTCNKTFLMQLISRTSGTESIIRPVHHLILSTLNLGCRLFTTTDYGPGVDTSRYFEGTKTGILEGWHKLDIFLNQTVNKIWSYGEIVCIKCLSLYKVGTYDQKIMGIFILWGAAAAPLPPKCPPLIHAYICWLVCTAPPAQTNQ